MGSRPQSRAHAFPASRVDRLLGQAEAVCLSDTVKTIERWSLSLMSTAEVFTIARIMCSPSNECRRFTVGLGL